MACLEFSRDRVHQPSLEAPDRTALETFAMALPLVCLAYRSRLARSFAAWPAWRALNQWPTNRHRSWDFALRSFSPAEQFRLYRVSAADAHVSFAPSQSPRLIFVGASAADPNQTQTELEPDSNRTLSLDSSRPILIAKAFAFWALTRPCQPSPAAGRLRRRSVLPWALPLSGLPDTPRGAAWRARPRTRSSAVARSC